MWEFLPSLLGNMIPQGLDMLTGASGASSARASANSLQGVDMSGIDSASGYPRSGSGSEFVDPATRVPAASGGASQVQNKLTTGLGVSQILAGIIQQRQAKRMLPSLTDPAQTAFLSDINMKRKNLAFNGADYAAGLGIVDRNLGANLDAVSKVNSGNTGAVLSSMAGAQTVANTGANQIAATGAGNVFNMDQFASGLTDMIAKRKLDIEMFSYLSKMAQAKQNINAGLDNTFSGSAPMMNK